MKYYFKQDQDCHWYMLPENLIPLWDELIQDEECWEDDRWQSIEDCRLDRGIESISFENPVVV